MSCQKFAHYKTERQQITSTSEEFFFFFNFSTNVSDWKTASQQCVPIHMESPIRPGHLNAHAQNMQMYKLFKMYLQLCKHITRQ